MYTVADLEWPALKIAASDRMDVVAALITCDGPRQLKARR